MFSARNSQNVTVSAMTIEDLIHWLRHVPRNREVMKVLFHVGVHSCKQTTIPETTWKQLIMHKLVPSLPPRAGGCVHNDFAHGTAFFMKGTVAASNASLLKVCQGEDMRCADHTSSFIAYSGAPR